MEFRFKKKTYGQIQGDYERLELCCHLCAYVTSASPPVWDLEYFDHMIFVAQCTNVFTCQVSLSSVNYCVV
jgi:hypothetical protein